MRINKKFIFGFLFLLLVIFLTTSVYSNHESSGWTANLNDGLVSYWNLDDTEGFVLDTLGNYHMTNFGALRGEDGLIMRAITTSTSTGYVVNEDINLGTGDFTVSLWVNLPSIASSNTPFTFGAFSPQFIITNSENSCDSNVCIYWGGWHNMGTRIEGANTWLHIILIRENSVVKCYINNIRCQNSFNSNDPLGVGFVLSSDRISEKRGGMDGSIDEVAIWNRALTEDEIIQLYNKGRGITYTDGDGDGFTFEVDCDDHNPDIHPNAQEICNNIDDNCNKQLDENLFVRCYTGPRGTNNVGICHGGISTCFEGKFGACIDEVTPQEEICDGFDNNCNWNIDEGFNDIDNDSVADCFDICVNEPNPPMNDIQNDDVPNYKHQPDEDEDGAGDICDNCPLINNTNQEDLDTDNIGDACDVQTCGNNIAEFLGTGDGFGFDELCDGKDLRRVTCQNLGFKYGELMCLADCKAYNISQCTNYLFLRGDANTDGIIDISDSVIILLFKFSSIRILCMDAADVNDDGQIDVADVSYLNNFLFLGGPAPPQPHPTRGTDPTRDNLGCKFYPK